MTPGLTSLKRFSSRCSFDIYRRYVTIPCCTPVYAVLEYWNIDFDTGMSRRYRSYPIVPGIITAAHRLNTDPSAAKALPEGSAGISETSATGTQRALTCSFTPTAILAAGSRYSFKLSIHAEASPAMASNWKLATCKITNYSRPRGTDDAVSCENRSRKRRVAEPQKKRETCGGRKAQGAECNGGGGGSLSLSGRRGWDRAVWAVETREAGKGSKVVRGSGADDASVFVPSIMRLSMDKPPSRGIVTPSTRATA